MRKIRVVLLLGLIGVVGASCTDADAPDPPASALESQNAVPADFLSFDAPDTGVLSSYSFPTGYDRIQADPDKSTIEFELLACRWEWPGRFAYDVRWQPPEDLALPATIRIEFARIVSDMGTGNMVEAVLDAPGEFTVLINDVAQRASRDRQDEDRPEPRTSWDSSRGDALEWSQHRCFLHPQSEHPTEVDNGDGTFELGGSGPRVDAPDGTVEQLLALIDPSDPDDPLMPLAGLYNDPTWPQIDRLWIAPTYGLESIEIHSQGPCMSVTSTYGSNDEPQVTLTQSLGFPPRSAAPGGRDPVIGIEDDDWQIRVSGPTEAIDDLVEQLAVVPFAGADSMTGDLPENDGLSCIPEAPPTIAPGGQPVTSTTPTMLGPTSSERTPTSR